MYKKCECCGKEIGLQKNYTYVSRTDLLGYTFYHDKCFANMLSEYLDNHKESDK